MILSQWWLRAFLFVLIALGASMVYTSPVSAQNVAEYSDTISNSRPGATANHTFRFRVREPVNPGGIIELQFPNDFTVANDDFGIRNIEMTVNNAQRAVATTTGPGVDSVAINPGAGGSILYTLHGGAGIPDEAEVELRLGTHTSNAVVSETVFSTSTGTTTIPVDRPPITNSSDIGTHKIAMEVTGGSETMAAEFSIAVIQAVGTGDVDTTETVPPFRFGPAPTSSVGGTTQFVEISIRTDEFAVCRYSDVAGVDFSAMSSEFENTGIVFHSTVVPVVSASVNRYYIRCIDDEGNFNIDDFELTFVAEEEPTGQANTEGETSGDGTGTGDDGTGDGGGSGGSTGEQDGEANTTGGTSGGGGSGGGGGGGSGSSSGGGGGGSQSGDGPFESGEATVVISGRAPADSDITILVDGIETESTTADDEGEFRFTFDEIARGVYTFGIYAEDDAGGRSSTFSTSFTVSGNRISNLSGITIAPTVRIEPDPVDIGQTLTVRGTTFPNAEVTLENQRQGTQVSRQAFTTTSDGSGGWTLDITTNGFSQDTYELRVQADDGSLGGKTSFSNFFPYGVGQEADVQLNSDLNRDGSVNLTDFSILLFWWGTAGGDSNPPADINRDGNVSLTDFSILLFNWTG